MITLQDGTEVSREELEWVLNGWTPFTTDSPLWRLHSHGPVENIEDYCCCEDEDDDE